MFEIERFSRSKIQNTESKPRGDQTEHDVDSMQTSSVRVNAVCPQYIANKGDREEIYIEMINIFLKKLTKGYGRGSDRETVISST